MIQGDPGVDTLGTMNSSTVAVIVRTPFMVLVGRAVPFIVYCTSVMVLL